MFNFQSLLVVALAGFSAVNADDSYNSYGGNSKKPRNFIMVIPDGFGPASETLARGWVHWNNNDTVTLPIDEMVIGQIRTRSTDSYVTDSAASATAYSCGIKSYNGAIGVGDDFEPCGTVLEAAKLQGFKTGLIVTSRITHATPASYAAHVYDRDIEGNIALQEIGHAHPLGRTVDVMMGGGRCFFTPQSTKKSCRKDDIDALKLAKGLGYSVFMDRASFDKPQKLPYLGLFTEDHMSYEIDRDPKVEPSLTEMVLKGLNDLYRATKNSDKGFFVMVEASRIDHAGHANDPVGHLHDILAYNSAMGAMRKWIDRHSDSPTVLISTADHECGGLTVGNKELDGPPEYWYDPSFFTHAKATAGVLAKEWAAYAGSDAKGYAKKSIFGKYGIVSPTDKELAKAVELKGKSSFATFLAGALSERLGVNFSTGGHTGSDVTLYGYGVNHLEFVGQHENTEVGMFVQKQLGLNLDKVTETLKKNATWLKDYVKPKLGTEQVARRSLAMHHH